MIPRSDWLGADQPEGGRDFGLLLAAVTVLALALRLYRLDGQSLWVDELMTFNQIRPGAGLVFWRQILDAIQGPLYQALLWPIVRWNAGEFWMRLPSALAGACAVPVLGLFTRRVAGARTGLLAALLLAINPFAVWYGQEARGYALLMLLVTVAGLLALDLMDRRGGVLHAVTLGLCGGLAMLANLSASFFWFALGITWLLLLLRGSGRPAWRWLLALGLGVLVAMPWLLRASGVWAVDRILPGAVTGEALRGASTFTPLAVPYTLFSFLGGFSLGPSLADLHVMGGAEVLARWWFLLVPLGLAAGVVLLRALPWALSGRGFLLVWIIVPLAVLALLAVRNIKPWNARYVAAALPWLVVLLAAGCTSLRSRAGVTATVLLVGFSLLSLGGYFWNPRYMREDVRGAAAYVKEHSVPGDVVLAPVVTAVMNHYDHGEAEVLSTFGLPLIDGQDAARRFVRTWLDGAPRVWLVWARPWDFDPRGELLRELARQGELTRVYDAAGVRVFRWLPRGVEAP